MIIMKNISTNLGYVHVLILENIMFFLLVIHALQIMTVDKKHNTIDVFDIIENIPLLMKGKKVEIPEEYQFKASWKGCFFDASKIYKLKGEGWRWVSFFDACGKE